METRNVKQILLKAFIIVVMTVSCVESVEYVDGTYRGVLKHEDNSYDWTPQLTVEVRGGHIVEASFDYIDDDAVDMQWLSEHTPAAGHESIEDSYRRMARDLVDKQKADIDSITGATVARMDFQLLAEKVLEHAQNGNTETAEVVIGQKKSVLSQAGGHTMAVVSSHRLATEAGMEILEEGGTAADAAYTVASVLTVVEPWFSSILGGGTWALYYDSASDTVYSLDGVGPAGSGARPELFERVDYGGTAGMHQAVVPGAWAGWMEWLKRFGTKSLSALLERAIQYAEEGIPVHREFLHWLKIKESFVREWPDTKAVYLPDGRFPSLGDIIRQKDMAKTMKELAGVFNAALIRGSEAAYDAANDYYYRGPIAEKIVAFSKNNGGLFELSDFTGFRTGFVDPIRIDYRDITVYQNPPNSQGITMLLGLNILEQFDFSGRTFNSPDTIHLIVEASKLAHVDKYYHVGDPAFVEVPVEELLSEKHARAQSARIDMGSALKWPIADILVSSGTDTTTFSVIDRYGNAAAVTTSLGAQFLVIGDTGIIINNRMRMMDFEKGNPNVIGPGKKVRHTSNPYMAMKNGKPYILGGNTGVDTQPQGQIQQFIAVVEFGLTPQEAVSHPRVVANAYPEGTWPHKARNVLAMEGGFPEHLREAMRKRGHNVTTGGTYGTANMIVIDPETGVISTGADSRAAEGFGIVR